MEGSACIASVPIKDGLKKDTAKETWMHGMAVLYESIGSVFVKQKSVELIGVG